MVTVTAPTKPESTLTEETSDFEYLRGLKSDGSSVKYKTADVSNVSAPPTVARFAATRIPTDLDAVRVSGYASPGDNGGHLKRRISTPSPVKPWHSQSSDGAWWEIAEPFVTPEMFGAKNDGATADDAAFDACYDWCMAQSNGGRIVLLGGAGYRLNAAHSIYPTVPLAIEWKRGARILCGLTDAANVLLKATHPSAPSTRGERLTLINPRIAFHSSTSGQIGCVLFEHRYASDLSIQGNAGEIQHYRNNTAVRISGLWNCDFDPVTLWGAGHQKVWKDVGSTTFSITNGGTSLTSNAALFSASDVGKSIAVWNSAYAQIFVISAYVDAQTVTVSKTAITTFSAAYGSFEAARGSMTSGDATLTMNKACLAASDVGRVVYVLNGLSAAGSGTSPKKVLRATITTVVSSTQATLSAAPDVAVSDEFVIFSPAIELYSEADSGTNDAVWDGLHLEEFVGTGAVISGGQNIHLSHPKFHAANNEQDASTSTFCAVFSDATGSVNGGLIEGTPINPLGRVYCCGLNGLLSLAQMSGVILNDQPLVYAENMRTAGVVAVGDWTLNNANAATRSLDGAFPEAVGSGYLIHNGSLSSYNTTWTSRKRRLYSSLEPGVDDVYSLGNDNRWLRIKAARAELEGVSLKAPAANITAITGGSLPCNYASFVTLDISGGATITEITSLLANNPIVVIRNINATAVSFTHNASKIRLTGGVNKSLPQHHAIAFIQIAWATFQQIALS